MKKTLLLNLVLALVVVSIVIGYQWKDEHGTDIYLDFTNGGAKTNQDDSNQSVVLGATMLLPFNSSGVGYNLYQGTLYIIWSNVQFGMDIIPPRINCSIIYRGVEWGEINCTSNDPTATWSMSIKENETQEFIYMFDQRTEGERKFIALKEDSRYIIQINATDTGGNNAIQQESFKTKLSGEHLTMLVAFIIGPLLLCFFFVYWGNSLSEEQEPLKWFMRLLSIIMIYVMFAAANIAANSDPDYAAYASIFDLTAYGWIIFTVLAVFLIWFIYKIFSALKQKKNDDLEHGRL